MTNKVLCDTTFIIRLLKSTEPLHRNARGYFKYLLENKYELYISTIAIAEYLTGAKTDIRDLPFQNLKIISFGLNDAKDAGAFAGYIFEQKRQNNIVVPQRTIIPNDTKLFAQAKQIDAAYYLSCDGESRKIFNLLKANFNIQYEFLDFHVPYSESFGIIPFE